MWDLLVVACRIFSWGMWNLFICGMQNFHCGMWDLSRTACKVFLVASRGPSLAVASSGYSLAAVHRLLFASLVVEHGL